MANRTIYILIFVTFGLLAILIGERNVADSTSAPHPIELRFSPGDLERSIIDIFEHVSPSVVQITTVIGADDPSKSSINVGSGFVWDTSGNVVTNEHVVQGATTIWIWLSSGEPLDAEVVGVAPNYDLAVIRLKQPRALPLPVPIGTSSGLKVGQFAYAIGSPFGLDQSLTMGVVSGLNRKLPTSEGQEIGSIIQTDAAIYPGNSGGPLLDSAGRLIGVNTISYAVTGSHAALGFAIPVDLVNRVVPELISVGRVATPGIGIVPDDGKAASSPRADGVLIARTKPGSPAERAGLQGINSSTIGDIITEANGKPVRSRFDLASQLERSGIGSRIALVINRNGALVRVDVEVVDVGAAR